MTSYHGWTHRPKEQGGTDPIPGLVPVAGTTSCYFDDWTFNGSGASVPDDTWEEVVTGTGANQRYFNEFDLDPASGFGRNFANGTISHSPTGYLFSAWGFVVFDVANGTEIGAAINWVGQEVQANYGIVRAGVKHLIVIAERVPMPAGGVSLQCYQKSGGAADLLEARLHVRRFELYQGVYTQDFAT